MKETTKKGFLRKNQKDYSLTFKLALEDRVEKEQPERAYLINTGKELFGWVKEVYLYLIA